MLGGQKRCRISGLWEGQCSKTRDERNPQPRTPKVLGAKQCSKTRDGRNPQQPRRCIYRPPPYIKEKLGGRIVEWYPLIFSTWKAVLCSA